MDVSKKEWLSGNYVMQPGLTNGQRFWTSSEGNAIWYDPFNSHWHAGGIKDLGSSNGYMKTFVDELTQECPNDKFYHWYYLKSFWSYVLDIFNDIRVQCVKGMKCINLIRCLLMLLHTILNVIHDCLSDRGEIQFRRTENFSNSSTIVAILDRSHDLNGEVEVKWKISGIDSSIDSLLFEDGEAVAVLVKDLEPLNISLDKQGDSIEIEIVEIVDDNYDIGENQKHRTSHEGLIHIIKNYFSSLLIKKIFFQCAVQL